MKLKRYKPLFLQIGILLFIFAILVFILEQQKQYINIEFSKRYESNRTIELSGFEEGESWKGNYSYDSQRVMEGNSSITLSSWFGSKNVISIEKRIKLSGGYTKGYLSLFIQDHKKLSDIKSFGLELSDASNNTHTYDLLPLLHVGWNRVPVVIPTWKNINHIALSLTANSNTIAEINLDRFWVENTTKYSSDIIISNNPSLSLRTIGERTYLYVSSLKQEVLTFVNPTSLQKGSITLSLIPEHSDLISFSLNGTEFKMEGKKSKECTITNSADYSTKKTLSSVSGGNDLYVFIKADVKGRTVTYSLSNNGLDFELCGAVPTTQKSPPRLTLQGSYLIDSYSAEY